MLKYIFILLFCLPISSLLCQEIASLMQEGFTEGITVDLKEPLYADGVLTTEKGGVIKGPNLRIQAKHICYIRKVIEEKPVSTIEAEGDLVIEFGEYVFVGQKLLYDFQSQTGTIICGRTNSGAWYFGGEQIELRSDGSYIIYNGYVTTSENEQPDWAIFTKEIEVYDNQYITAKQVQLQILQFPILWIPCFNANLDFIFDSPIRYRLKWGRQGPRFGFTYEVFSWDRWKTFIRFDYRLTRGPGGGIEMYYRSLDHKTEFQSINYITQDSSIFNFKKNVQYRFEGVFKKLMNEDKTTILFTYDKISDLEIPSSYYDRDFDFETSERTQLLVRHQENDWISNFYSRVRINSFQTVKQELPTLGINVRPFLLSCSGIIVENWVKASYLDYKYAKHHPLVKDYSSTRFEYRPRAYRSVPLDPVVITPELGGVSIFYGDSPDDDAKWLILGLAGVNVQTQLYRHYGNFKHAIEPYLSFHYYTSPTVPPNDHYIFDLDDGWYRLNKLTLGVRNLLLLKRGSCVSRLLCADIYTHAFPHTPHIQPLIPKLYGRLVLALIPTVRNTLETAWDFRHHQIAYFNTRIDWTLDADFAIATEYRHRNAYSWRKVDPENFFLESFRSEGALRCSPLSDRRDTLLLHLFYRFHPNWACEFSSRHGWDRMREPSYSEYEIDLLTTIQTAWHLRLSYQHRENNDRLSLYINVGLRRPSNCDCDPVCYYD